MSAVLSNPALWNQSEHCMEARHAQGCFCSVIGQDQRQSVASRASGVVLDLGFGSGANLDYYCPKAVQKVIGIEHRDHLVQQFLDTRPNCEVELQLMCQNPAWIALPSMSIDTAVMTYALCALPQPFQVLREIRRVLKPGGKLLMCEHGRSTRPQVARLQRRARQWMRWLPFGCHFDRDPVQLVMDAGFAFTDLTQFSRGGLAKLFGFHHIGTAMPI